MSETNACQCQHVHQRCSCDCAQSRLIHHKLLQGVRKANLVDTDACMLLYTIDRVCYSNCNQCLASPSRHQQHCFKLWAASLGCSIYILR
jgi:hypothetical protein